MAASAAAGTANARSSGQKGRLLAASGLACGSDSCVTLASDVAPRQAPSAAAWTCGACAGRSCAAALDPPAGGCAAWPLRAMVAVGASASPNRTASK